MAVYEIQVKLVAELTVPDSMTELEVADLLTPSWWDGPQGLKRILRRLYPHTGPPSGRSPVVITNWHTHGQQTRDEAE